MCSYTSSVTTQASYRAASPAMVSSSSRENTLPQGFEGLQRMSARAPCRKASSRTSGSKRKSGGTSGT